MKTIPPRALAEAIGVSESSIKRWVDDGLIEVIRTAGGHRRILAQEAIRFIRNRRLFVFHPEKLGISGLSAPGDPGEPELSADHLFQILKTGEAASVRRLVTQAFLSGISLDALFDGPFSRALADMGELWKHGADGIYHEHVATSICVEAVHYLRTLLPPPPPGAPITLGGTLEGDPYLLPGLMASTVLLDAGCNDVFLGPNTPVAAFDHAIELHRPTFVWLSMTAHPEEGPAQEAIHTFLWALDRRSVEVVIGGQSATAHADHWPESIRLLSSMTDLARFAAGKLAG